MVFKKKIDTGKSFLLPVIPVIEIVVFPSTIVPLFVNRRISIRALEQAISTNSDVLIVTQTEKSFDEKINVEKLPKVGTICKIIQSMKLPDGTMKITLDCICRGSIEEYERTDCIRAKTYLPQVAGINPVKVSALMKDLQDVLQRYIENNGNKFPQDVLQNLETISDPAIFVDIVSSRIDVADEDKLSILGANQFEDRIATLIDVLTRENEIEKMQREIRKRADKNIAKNNREYYLKEQMNVIKKELGEGDNTNDLIDKYEKKLTEKKLPEKVVDVVKEEIKKLKYLGTMSSEAGVVRGYLDTIFELPWNEETPLNNDFHKAEKILEDSHYGMEKAKERILESIAVQIKTGKQSKKNILCLYGPPGVGKTSLAEAMAKATGREFVKIALGGVCDEAAIRGHRRTYLGSMPGKIIKAMKQAKTTNPLILLDELDKLTNDQRGDPASALLEVLDYQQNSKFVDHYLDFEYDLSKVMFVATANSLKISAPLLDRIELIKVPSYLEHEKFKIAKKYILPRQMEENGLTKEDCKISDGVITEIIQHYTREAGVRDLERKLAKLCRKAVIEQLKTKKPVIISNKNVKKYLGVQKYDHTVIERKDFVGVVNGLAYTEVGGDILMIEAAKLPNGKGEIKYTGELGTVMKESIQTAFSLVKSKAKEFGIDAKELKNIDIHVHVPDGATPKDGPSAGITITTAIVSLLKNKCVSKHLAMTGEVSLRGAVLPIGGLREKLTSAVRSGVKEVIIPKDNKKDLEELPQDIISKLKIHPCSRIEEVIKTVACL